MLRGSLAVVSIAAFGVLTGSVIYCVGLTGNALTEANDRLATVDSELTAVSGNADPLTAQVDKVNSSLTQIEQALHPLHGQADQLNGILAGASQTLTSADGTVKSILSKAGPIETSLADADTQLASEADEVGSTRASARVLVLSGQATTLISLLTPIEADLHTIEALLGITNDHLASTCNHLQTGVIPQLSQGVTC